MAGSGTKVAALRPFRTVPWSKIFPCSNCPKCLTSTTSSSAKRILLWSCLRLTIRKSAFGRIHEHTSFMHQILVFLKDQVRSWPLRLVDCSGARRITPLFETKLSVGATFVTQEYRVRGTIVAYFTYSMAGTCTYLGLFSALLHVIYNPSEAEFREWIPA